MKWQNSKTVRGETGREWDRVCVIWAPTETSGGFQIDVVSVADVSLLLFGSTVGCCVAASWNYISLNALALSFLFSSPLVGAFIFFFLPLCLDLFNSSPSLPGYTVNTRTMLELLNSRRIWCTAFVVQMLQERLRGEEVYWCSCCLFPVLSGALSYCRSVTPWLANISCSQHSPFSPPTVRLSPLTPISARRKRIHLSYSKNTRLKLLKSPQARQSHIWKQRLEKQL